jgi:hypothetical protein
MGVRANITLTDATPVTPVARVFSPVGQAANGVINWRDITQGVYAGQNRLSCLQRAVSKTARTNSMAWKLELPILEQTAAYGPYSVAFTNLVNLGFIFHERASDQNRLDALTMTRDLIDEQIITYQVQNLDFIW